MLLIDKLTKIRQFLASEDADKAAEEINALELNLEMPFIEGKQKAVKLWPILESEMIAAALANASSCEHVFSGPLADGYTEEILSFKDEISSLSAKNGVRVAMRVNLNTAHHLPKNYIVKITFSW